MGLSEYVVPLIHEEVSRKMLETFIKNYQINIIEKITSDFRGIFRTRLNIYDGACLQKYLILTIFAYKLHHGYSTGF